LIASEALRHPGYPRRLPDQESRGDPALFGEENVVGTAGGLHVHDLHADSGLYQGLQDLRAGKAQPRPGAEQNDFTVQTGERRQVLGHECFEARRRPVPFHTANPGSLEASKGGVPEFTAVMEKDEIQRLEDAKKTVIAEQEKLRNSLMEKENELERLRRELNET